MTSPNIPKPVKERRLSFNPEAHAFNPNAIAFQPTPVQPTIHSSAMQPSLQPDLQSPWNSSLYNRHGTPPLYRGPVAPAAPHIGNALVSRTPAPQPLGPNGIFPPPIAAPATSMFGASSARRPLPIQTQPSYQSVSSVEVISPRPQKTSGLAKHLEAHPTVQDQTAEYSSTVSAPWRKAEMEMAKRDPQGWASLAKENLKGLLEFYSPGLIPQEILSAHITKYKEVYDSNPFLAQEIFAEEAGTSVIKAREELPQGIAQLANAHAAALNVFQNARRKSSTLPDFNALRPQHNIPNYTPASARGFAVSNTPARASTSTTHHRQQSTASSANTQLFSPGPAFPALGQDSATFPPPQNNIRTTGPSPANRMFAIQDWQGQVGMPTPHHPRNHNGVSLSDYMTNRSARRNHRGGTKVRKGRLVRPKRLDQGPEPSAADIYPDDEAFMANQGHNVTNFDVDGLLQENMRALRLGSIREDSSEMLSSPPQFGAPVQHFNPHMQMTEPNQPINPAYLPVFSPVQEAVQASDGISDIEHISPLTTTPHAGPQRSTSRTPASGDTERTRRLVPVVPNPTRMAPDQVDGTRYGLPLWGVGHGPGKFWKWEPPKPIPGTRFAHVGYLWERTSA